MKRMLIFLLQSVIILIGLAVCTFLIWEPQIEGANVHKTLMQIYFQDPFIAYAYIAAIPFFIILYKTIKILGVVRNNTVISPMAMQDLRTIKYCALVIIAFVIVGEIFILSNTSDDHTGGVFIGIFISSGSLIIGAVAAKFERVLLNAKKIPANHNLTV